MQRIEAIQLDPCQCNVGLCRPGISNFHHVISTNVSAIFIFAEGHISAQ